MKITNNMTHKKQYDNAIPSSTDCNRYPRNDLELYNNHAENDRIFNPRTNHKVYYWKVHWWQSEQNDCFYTQYLVIISFNKSPCIRQLYCRWLVMWCALQIIITQYLCYRLNIIPVILFVFIKDSLGLINLIYDLHNP